jgi:hypothetical protein
MKLLVLDFPGVTSQHYDQLCRSVSHGTPLSTLAEFRRARYQVVAHIAGPTPDGGWRVVDGPQTPGPAINLSTSS